MAEITRSSVLVLARRTIQEFMDDQCMTLAASIAYYGFLSLFPLILFLIAVLSLFLQSAGVQEQLLDQVGSYLPGAREFVSDTIQGVIVARGPIGIISALTLLWSATGVFGCTSLVMEQIWAVKNSRSLISQNLLNIGLAVAAGIFLLLSMGISGVFRYFTSVAAPFVTMFPISIVWWIVGILLPFIFSVVLFFLIYKILPYAWVAWQEALLGAAVAAILFEILKNIFAWYSQNLANYNLVYGSVGTVVVLMTWIYFSAVVLLLGAELSATFARQRRVVVIAKPGPKAEAQKRPNPSIAVAVSLVTIGMIILRTMVWTRTQKGGPARGLLAFLKRL